MRQGAHNMPRGHHSQPCTICKLAMRAGTWYVRRRGGASCVLGFCVGTVNSFGRNYFNSIHAHSGAECTHEKQTKDLRWKQSQHLPTF
jgi:hypothetical protein